MCYTLLKAIAVQVFIPKEIAQNLAMSVDPVRRMAMRFHRTGLNNEQAAVDEIFSFYSSQVDLEGRSILELGPGQTMGVLLRAKEQNAGWCSAADVAPYLDQAECDRKGIDYRIYNGTRLPFPDESFDISWSSDVFEHLRAPRGIVKDLHRTLRASGTLITRVDLRDHYHLADEERWLSCLRYSTSTWRAMTWFRSSFVNRLRYSEWRELFRQTGFEEKALYVQRSEVLLRLREKEPYLQHLDDDDVSVYSFDAVLEKKA